MSTNLKAGKYKGKLMAYGAQETTKGDPMIVLKFVIAHDGQDHDVYWRGGLQPSSDGVKKAPREITFETLETCGFDFAANTTLAAVAEGPGSNALDIEKDYGLTIEIETYEGKPQARVKFVNDPMAGIRNRMGKDPFVVKCKGLNIEGAMAQFRRGRNAPAARASQAAAGADQAPPIADADLPF